jgi:hypothetical protein
VVIVVNAATNPTNDRDKTASVPGLFDTIAAATVPMDNFTADTLDRHRHRNWFRDRREPWRTEKVAARAAVEHRRPTGGFLPRAVAFDYIVSKSASGSRTFHRESRGSDRQLRAVESGSSPRIPSSGPAEIAAVDLLKSRVRPTYSK